MSEVVATLKYEGTLVKMGGRDFIVPPLNLRQLKKFSPVLNSFNSIKSVPTVEDIDNMIAVIHAAVSRNYPELQPEELEDLIDLSNLASIFQAVMSASGLVQGNA